MANPNRNLTGETPSNEPPAKIAWRCTCFNARRAARAATEMYDRILAPSGVGAAQFTLLGAVAMLGPGPISRLAENLSLDRTTLTRNLKLLQKQGWIAADPGRDRRERVVSLTEDGRAALARAMPLWRAAQDRMEKQLGAERLRRLHEDLAALASIAGTAPD